MIKKILCFILLLFFMIVAFFSIKRYIELKNEITEVEKINEELIDIAEIPEEIDKTEEFKVNFEELRKINSNIIGWILIEGTNINYPIVQGDNNTYYLKHNVYKEYNSAGAIYMDATADPNFNSLNTFIYGHYTPQGIMFGELGKFMNQSFFDSHRNVYIFTPEQNYAVEIFSVYVDNASSPSYQMNFTTDEAYKNYIDLMKDKSSIRSNVEVDYTQDRIVTLYSCSRETNYKKQDRYYIHGKLSVLN